MEALRQLKNLIIDMDGVLYRGNRAFPSTSDFVTFLRDRGFGFVLATNNSTQTPDQYVEKLAGMGVTVHADEILTSAQATASHLADIAPPGTKVFVVGQDGLRASLQERGFDLVEDGAEYVVAGMDFTIRYERLAEATLQIRAGARFIGTNPDRTFPSERGIVPGAGSLLALLEVASGVTPSIVGKPGIAMMEQAMARMDANPASTGMLGDRLETDILAGQRAGLLTLLVLSGVTDRAMLDQSSIQPDLVFLDIGDLKTQWQEALDG
jgi:4-nitrophenyl phosphatase